MININKSVFQAHYSTKEPHKKKIESFTKTPFEILTLLLNYGITFSYRIILISATVFWCFPSYCFYFVITITGVYA